MTVADVSPSIAARLSEMAAEIIALRARLDLMTREARLSREATDRAVARLAENEVAFRKMAETAEAYSRELHKAKAALARVEAECVQWNQFRDPNIDRVVDGIRAALRGPQDEEDR